MRIVATLILSILITSCLIPCSEIDILANSFTHAKGGEANTHHAGNDLEDICSPFCSCACCPGFSAAHSAHNVVIYAALRHQTYSEFTPASLCSLPSSIWQPPQLS